MKPSAPANACFVYILLLSCACAGVEAKELGMPLPVDICPTSSFGSWRPGHFHAGVDFSTGGVTGVPVLAVDTCWVWRIRLWNGGYGKTLYAQLGDGRIAVYGHLSGFAPEIEAMVEEEQDLRGAYEVEIYCEPRAFTFSRGDTLAFSGETGAGPPHLHFELRSGRHDHNKINPVPDYMDLSEGFRPEIRRVLLTPLSASGAIDGAHRPYELGRPTTGADTLRIGGEFGVSVYAVDRVQCGRMLTPIAYEALIDDTSIWRLDLDTFPFSKAHFIGALAFSWGGKTYVRLYDPYDLDLTGFSCVRTAGATGPGILGPGSHLLRIRVADAWGNEDDVAIPFVYGTAPEFTTFRLIPDSLGITVQVGFRPETGHAEVAYRIEEGDWQAADLIRRNGLYTCRAEVPEGSLEARCWLVGEYGFSREGRLSARSGGESAGGAVASAGAITPGAYDVSVTTSLREDYLEILGHSPVPPASLPTAHIFEGSRVASVLLQPVGDGDFRGVYVPGSEADVIHLRTEFEFARGEVERTEGFAVGRLSAGGEVWFTGERFKMRLHVPESGSKETFVRFEEGEGRQVDGFSRSAGSIRLEPDDRFFSDRVEVLVISRADSLGPGWGLYSEGDGWTGYLGKFDETGVCRVEPRWLTNMIVLEDSCPPVLEWTGPLRARQSDGKAIFTAKAGDSGSGLDVNSLKAYVDEDVAIVAYDPDGGGLTVRSRKALRYGKHRIRLEAEDRMGNAAHIEKVADLVR